MRITNHKKNILILFSAPLVLGILYCLLVYALDPFALFHNRVLKIGVLNNLRIQAAGAINSADFDSIILGTSILENTSAKEASDIVGGKFVNISISGSTFYERRYVLDYILRKKDIKTVIYSMDAVYTNPTYEVENYPVSRYDFLYNDSTLDNMRAYFDFAILGCVIKNKMGSLCMSDDYDFDRPNAWLNVPEQMSRFGGLQNWFKAENSQQIVQALSGISRDAKLISDKNLPEFTQNEIDAAIKTAIDYIDVSITKYIQQNPDVEFHLMFPPYSRLAFAQWYQLNHIDVPVHAAVLRHLVTMADKLPNMHVYGYEDQPFLDDLSNYKDTLHYHPDYNTLMLRSIHSRKNLLTTKNIDSYLKISRQKSMDFDLIGLGRQIDDYLASKNKE